MRRIVEKPGQRACRDDLAQGRKVLTPACREIDYAAIGHGAVSDGAIDGECGEARRGHHLSNQVPN